MSGHAEELERLANEIHRCRACPRLVAWRQESAANPPKRYRSENYFARPLEGFGDPDARVLLVGLAPAAHGGNRTGRIFTGDRSGDWLFAALWRTGFANQPESARRGDNLELTDCFITAAVRCAPPQNRPTTEERDNCHGYLVSELQLLPNARTIVALGSFAWDAVIRVARDLEHSIPKPKPRFGHGAETQVGPWHLIGCFHPSQQNTFTGRLTEEMTDQVLQRAKSIAGSE